MIFSKLGHRRTIKEEDAENHEHWDEDEEDSIDDNKEAQDLFEKKIPKITINKDKRSSSQESLSFAYKRSEP